MKKKNKVQKRNTLWAIPNILTYIRILIIPAIFCILYSNKEIYSNVLACALFGFASLTDYFDGYLSRKMKLTSEIGRFLDPIADKLLVATVLIVLVQTKFVGIMETILASIIICREIFVSGLREYLGNFHTKMPVSKLAKWKTTAQLFAISFLIFGNPHTNKFYNSFWDYFTFNVYIAGICFLLIACVLTIWTGKQYMTTAFKYMQEKN
ncbi:MAG: CDP-diacylglycerol--glycerol-3-phosphate 3-phosphatidyltransferase [bacterium]|nr:CDP-diacylglycerol--glycerol-3-phosphate 3-phosphatidyltransferase [bacterium]